MAKLRERAMNIHGTREMLALITLMALVLAAAPSRAEEYVVEPIVDGETVDDEAFSMAELDQMLAPIALYPDSLLSQLLIASTYPLEIVEAARWSRSNPQLEGEAAVEAVADMDWDPSVKALVAFPDLLARLDEDLEWTRRLGDAFLYQEAQVMDSIQFLRARADAAGNLESTEYAQVIREKETIIIQPARERVVYVPYYDPWVVYGPWWRPAYPPVVWAAPSYYHYGYPGYYWGSGVHLSAGFFFTNFYWPHRSLIVVHTPYYYRPRHHHRPYYAYYVPGKPWRHNPVHRRNVEYRQQAIRDRYGRTGTSASSQVQRQADSRRERLSLRDGESRWSRSGDGRSGRTWSGEQHSADSRSGQSPEVERRRSRPESAAVEQRLRSTQARPGAVTGAAEAWRDRASQSGRGSSNGYQAPLDRAAAVAATNRSGGRYGSFRSPTGDATTTSSQRSRTATRGGQAPAAMERRSTTAAPGAGIQQRAATIRGRELAGSRSQPQIGSRAVPSQAPARAANPAPQARASAPAAGPAPRAQSSSRGAGQAASPPSPAPKANSKGKGGGDGGDRGNGSARGFRPR
jgi:hypothetical protein